MKIAVVGAGIFGISAALKLSRAGYDVDLIERYGDILQAASGINQYRVHRGYHYPRSIETSTSASQAEAFFREEYGDAIRDHNEHYYGIAREGSKVSAEQFKDFCRRCNLEFEEVSLPLLDGDEIQLTVKVKEALFDPLELYKVCKQKLKDSSVKLRFNQTADHRIFSEYDMVVNCTYANLNSVLHPDKHAKKKYQFELCEKPVLRLSQDFAKKSIVILDGPFMCIDPLGTTDLHVMGNVVHALHVTGVDHHLEIPDVYRSVLNKGIVPADALRDMSRIKDFLESAERFIPKTKYAEHVGSMFTIRTVLPNLDHSDARPTVVEQVDDNLITVFSGKIGNSLVAADEVVRLVTKKAASLR